MKFTANQWAAVFALDVLFKFVFISLAAPHPISFLIEFFFSTFYFSLLIFANVYAQAVAWPARKSAVFVLTFANVIFISTKSFFEIYYPIVGRATMCTDNICKWVDGAITGFGLQAMIVEMFVRLLLNVAPFLIVLFVGLRRANQLKRE